MTVPVLEIADVVVFAAGRPVLDAPHLAVGPGETVALVGPNGAGKTTLLHVAALLRPADRGSVTIQGTLATRRNAAMLRRHLSVVFQAPLLFDVSVLANAAAGARFHGLGRSEAERRAREWLARFGIDHLAQRKTRSLSGGEAARVALTRAFATAPALLLLDEPFSALDAPTRAQLLPILRSRLQETSTAAVLVTHDLEEAFAFADRLVLMDAGRILASGPARTLITRPPSARAAELLGVENILPADVACVDGDIISLALRPRGQLVRLRTDQPAGLLTGREVDFMVPAVAVRLLAEEQPVSEERNLLRGCVVEVTPLRSGTRVVLETPVPIVAIAPWDGDVSRWSIGDHATALFSLEAGHWVPRS